MLTYNLQQLRNLLQDIATLVDATVTLYDENFNSTSAYGTSKQQHFCKTLKANGYTAHCSESDMNAFNKFSNGDNHYYYHCHFGFIEIVYKIIFNNKTQGYVIVGPFRDEKIQEKQLNQIRAYCQKANLNAEEQIQKFYDITVFSEEKYNALTSLFFSIINYAQSQNIITIKTNLFSEKIEPFILNNLHADLSNQTLQKTFFLSEKQLYSVFLTCTNKTPKQYINHHRVVQARNLIVSTDYSLAKISSMVGFDDYNYFIKVFKKHDGHTPLFYRKHKNK